jgi:hypothetical protein
MRRSQRLVTAAVLIALCSALTGCGSFGTGWDPSDLLDFLDTKKKLPGDRKPVFPEGVPGLQQGVPRELYKGNVEQPQDNVAVTPAPPQESKGRAKSKRAAVNVGAVRNAPEAAPAEADAPVEEAGTGAAPPAPKGQKIVRRRTTAPPPDAAPAQQPAPTSFPAPVPSSTFSR